MASKQFPYLIFIARLCAGTLAGVGLAFYTLVLIKCLDYRFPGQGKFLTAMPVIGASISVAWNIFALLTIVVIGPIWHSIGDALTIISLVPLGALGLYHDSTEYLSTGMYLQYADDSWLFQEIFGSTMLLLSAITQLILMVMSISKHRKNKRVAQFIVAEETYSKDVFVEPLDTGKGEDFKVETKSVSSFESGVSEDTRVDTKIAVSV